MGVASISIDSVPSASFTPQEPLVELLRICLSKNATPFLTECNEKHFLVTWLIKEWSKNLSSNKFILLVVASQEKVTLWSKFLSRLTFMDLEGNKNLIVTTQDDLNEIVTQEKVDLVSLLIVENGHILMHHDNVINLTKQLVFHMQLLRRLILLTFLYVFILALKSFRYLISLLICRRI